MAKKFDDALRTFLKESKLPATEKEKAICRAVYEAHLNMKAARKALTPTAEHYGTMVEKLPSNLRVSHQTIDNHKVSAAFRDWLIKTDSDEPVIKGSKKNVSEETAKLKEANKKLLLKAAKFDTLNLELMKAKAQQQKSAAQVKLLIHMLNELGYDANLIIRERYEWNGLTYIDRQTGEFLSCELEDIDEQ